MKAKDYWDAQAWFKALPEKERTAVMLKIGTRDFNKIAEYWIKHIK